MTLDSEIWKDDNRLRAVFSWLTRIGAAPAFGSRPIDWYQQHQCAAIAFLENELCLRGQSLRTRNGWIQAQINGKWVPQIRTQSLFEKADNFCRTEQF